MQLFKILLTGIIVITILVKIIQDDITTIYFTNMKI